MEEGLKDTKICKAAGFDDIYEFLINCGGTSQLWLVKFSNDILNVDSLTPEFKWTKIIAKNLESQRSYLRATKLLLSAAAITIIVLRSMQRFPWKKLCLRVAVTVLTNSVTTHIEAVFERGMKTSIWFIDLTAVYYTG